MARNPRSAARNPRSAARNPRSAAPNPRSAAPNPRSAPTTPAGSGPADGQGTDLGIVDALAQLTFLVHRTLADHAAAHGLSLAQIRLLGILRDRTPTMLELAGLLDLDKSSTSGLVDRAERRHLVRRVPAEDDRRSVRVALTAPGRHLVDRAATAFADEVRAATGSLTEQERTQLSVLASRVVQSSVRARRPPDQPGS